MFVRTQARYGTRVRINWVFFNTGPGPVLTFLSGSVSFKYSNLFSLMLGSAPVVNVCGAETLYLIPMLLMVILLSSVFDPDPH
jgi:hypothetical protein